MHIEPGVVDGAKIILSYATGAAALGLTAKMSLDTIRHDGGAKALVLRSVFTTLLVLVFFEVLPHPAVGVSEVHFIFGATLYLIFGTGPAAIGLVVGLLLQGLLWERSDLPQYFINITTLIAPLWAVAFLARRIVTHDTPYVRLRYWQALLLSGAYQGGVILLVACWAFYGRGFGTENAAAVALFAGTYLIVIVVEPLVTLGVLALAKLLDPIAKSPIFYNRLHHPVA